MIPFSLLGVPQYWWHCWLIWMYFHKKAWRSQWQRKIFWAEAQKRGGEVWGEIQRRAFSASVRLLLGVGPFSLFLFCLCVLSLVCVLLPVSFHGGFLGVLVLQNGVAPLPFLTLFSACLVVFTKQAWFALLVVVGEDSGHRGQWQFWDGYQQGLQAQEFSLRS